jgi:hypothetical protein
MISDTYWEQPTATQAVAYFVYSIWKKFLESSKPTSFSKKVQGAAHP